MKKVFLFFAMAALFAGVGCNSGGGGILGSDSPETVVRKFVDALGKKDMDQVRKYVTKDSESFVSMMKMGIDMAPDSDQEIVNTDNVEYGKAEINGDRATVNVRDKNSNQSSNFILKKEGGAWKVAFDKASFMEMSGEKMNENSLQDMQDAFDGDKLREAAESTEGFTNESLQEAGKMLDSMNKVLEEVKSNPQTEAQLKEMLKKLQGQ